MLSNQQKSHFDLKMGASLIGKREPAASQKETALSWSKVYGEKGVLGCILDQLAMSRTLEVQLYQSTNQKLPVAEL